MVSRISRFNGWEWECDRNAAAATYNIQQQSKAESDGGGDEEGETHWGRRKFSKLLLINFKKLQSCKTKTFRDIFKEEKKKTLFKE